MQARLILPLGACCVLAACVAPESPPPPRVASPAAAPAPSSATAHFEDAPVPNLKAPAYHDPGNIRIVQ